jgi:hypothetical protein
VTRAANQISDEQQQLLNRIAIQCPEVVSLRQIALKFSCCSEFGPVIRFALSAASNNKTVATI